MTTYHELPSLQRDMLVIIAGRDGPSGLEVGERLEAGPIDRMYHSRLYQGLDGLVEAGLVEKRAADGRTNAYSLTDAGERALDDWLGWLADELA